MAFAEHPLTLPWSTNYLNSGFLNQPWSFLSISWTFKVRPDRLKTKKAISFLLFRYFLYLWKFIVLIISKTKNISKFMTILDFSPVNKDTKDIQQNNLFFLIRYNFDYSLLIWTYFNQSKPNWNNGTSLCQSG